MAAFCEMTISVAVQALERDLLVVQLLDMAPITQGELYGFRKSFLEVDLNTYAGAGVLISFWVRAIQE